MFEKQIEVVEPELFDVLKHSNDKRKKAVLDKYDTRESIARCFITRWEQRNKFLVFRNAEEFVKYVAGFLQSATNLRAQRNKFIESAAKNYIGKLGEKYIPDMITDDIEQKYRNEIAEVSKMWKAKFM